MRGAEGRCAAMLTTASARPAPSAWSSAADLFEASAEMRVKLTDTIGVVPFFDAGNAFASGFPDFSRPLFMAAGRGCATIRRSARSASTSHFHSSVIPAPAGWRSLSASGRPSDAVISLPHPVEDVGGDDRRSARFFRAGLGRRVGQGGARRPDLEGALDPVDQRLHRRGRWRALLRCVDGRTSSCPIAWDHG